MKSRMLVAILCACILVMGGLTFYWYMGDHRERDYSSGMFVDRGDQNGYATMYDILETL